LIDALSPGDILHHRDISITTLLMLSLFSRQVLVSDQPIVLQLFVAL